MTRRKTKGERKRTATTKHNTSNSSYFSSGRSYSTILSVSTKLFVIFKKWFNRFFLCSGMKIDFLLSSGSK